MKERAVRAEYNPPEPAFNLYVTFAFDYECLLSREDLAQGCGVKQGLEEHAERYIHGLHHDPVELQQFMERLQVEKISDHFPPSASDQLRSCLDLGAGCLVIPFTLTWYLLNRGKEDEHEIDIQPVREAIGPVRIEARLSMSMPMEITAASREQALEQVVLPAFASLKEALSTERGAREMTHVFLEVVSFRQLPIA